MKNKKIQLLVALMFVISPFVSIGSIYQTLHTIAPKIVNTKNALASKLIDNPVSALTQTPSSINQPTRTPLPTKAVVSATSGFGYTMSISGKITTAGNTNVVLVNGSGAYTSYPATAAGVKQALYFIYSAGTVENWVLYFPNIPAANPDAASVAKGIIASPSATNMNFNTLSGHAKSLTLVSTPSDTSGSNNTNNTAQESGSAPVIFPADVYFGVPTVFRNISFYVNGGNNMYAQGNALAFMGGTWALNNAPLNVYGGSDSTDITGDTNLYFYATGPVNLSIYGGNNTGGTISGSTHVSIKGTRAASSTGLGQISVLTGGSRAGGTITGDTNLEVTQANEQITNIYGAGIGTTSSSVTVKGDAVTNINSSSAATAPNMPTYGTYYGGVAYGDISGSVYNTFKGVGKWTGSGIGPGGPTGAASQYVGGSFRGNIGTNGNNNVISNSYDTSQFTSGTGFFTGANGGTTQIYQNGTPSANASISTGVIYANVTNYVRAAANGTNGALYGVVGGNGHEAAHITLANAGLSSSTDTNYGPNYLEAKNYASVSPATSDANLKANINSGYSALVGNVYSWLQGGVMSTTQGGGYGDFSGYTYGGSVYGYL